MHWTAICEFCMNVCSLQIFRRPGHLSWRRVSVLSPLPFSNWNHQSWQTHTCRRCKTRANFNICVSSNRKTVDVQHCSAEHMQIYSKLNQLLSRWEVSARAASVKITLRHKKAEVTPLFFQKKAHFHKWNWTFPWRRNQTHTDSA